MNLSEYLEQVQQNGVSADVSGIVMAIAAAGVRIAQAVATADTGKAGTKNAYGEEQATLDVLTDKIMQEECSKVPAIGMFASEELDKPLELNETGQFTLCTDPLDGSSLIDVNLSVGTIVGVYPMRNLVGHTPREQQVACFILYGPRTTMMLTVGQGTHEFTLRDGVFVMSKADIKIAEEGKMFAPGNLRASKERQDYVQLMEYWMKEQYTLRYSGGMVPDINHILIKAKGVFVYPPYSEMPEGKLRLLFECGPLAMIVEQAGGLATDGMEPILDKQINEYPQRTPIFVGSKKEVEKAMEMMN